MVKIRYSDIWAVINHCAQRRSKGWFFRKKGHRGKERNLCAESFPFKIDCLHARLASLAIRAKTIEWKVTGKKSPLVPCFRCHAGGSPIFTVVICDMELFPPRRCEGEGTLVNDAGIWISVLPRLSDAIYIFPFLLSDGKYSFWQHCATRRVALPKQAWK